MQGLFLAYAWSMTPMQKVAQRAEAHTLRAYGLEKVALTPGVLAGVLGGLGAGAEAYRSFWDAPTEETLQSRLGKAGLGFVRGGAIGGALGYGAGHALGHLSPETVQNFEKWKPFSEAGHLGDPLREGSPDFLQMAANHIPVGGWAGLALKHLPSPEKLQQGANSAWQVCKHPAVRALTGVGLGYGVSNYVKEKVDDWRVKQYAAQRMEKTHPEVLNPGEVGFAMGGKHMGGYQSSKD